MPDDWKRSGLSQPQLERHARRWLVPVAVGILNLTSDWNVGAVKNIQSMFYRDNSRWDVRAVRDVQQTFYSASAWEALTH